MEKWEPTKEFLDKFQEILFESPILGIEISRKPENEISKNLNLFFNYLVEKSDKKNIEMFDAIYFKYKNYFYKTYLVPDDYNIYIYFNYVPSAENNLVVNLNNDNSEQKKIITVCPFIVNSDLVSNSLELTKTCLKTFSMYMMSDRIKTELFQKWYKNNQNISIYFGDTYYLKQWVQLHGSEFCLMKSNEIVGLCVGVCEKNATLPLSILFKQHKDFWKIEI